MKTIVDRNGKKVRKGDTIKFKRQEEIYQVTSRKNELGCYGDHQFIPLKFVLNNFEIV